MAVWELKTSQWKSEQAIKLPSHRMTSVARVLAQRLSFLNDRLQ